MKYTTFFLCACSILLLGSCKKQPVQNEQPLEVMTFNIRLDAPSDSANNWKYRKDNACKMIAYYQPDLLGMQEVCHNQMEDLKQGLPQYTALGVGRDDGKEAGEYCPVFFKTDRFTLVEYGNVSLSEYPDTIGIKGWDASYNRVTTWAVLQEKNNGKKFVYFGALTSPCARPIILNCKCISKGEMTHARTLPVPDDARARGCRPDEGRLSRRAHHCRLTGSFFRHAEEGAGFSCI